MRYTKITALIILVLTLLYGCDAPETIGGGVDTETSSPAGVAKSIENALNNGKASELENLYSPDMVFYFDPDEVGTVVEDHAVPETWSGAVDIEKLKLTLINGVSLTVDIDEGAIGTPPAEKGTYTSPAVEFYANYQYSS